MTTLELQTLKEVDRIMDRIVELAEKAIKQTKVYGRLCENDHWSIKEKCPECNRRTRSILQRSQLSNLQNLANATDSVKALELFVRYQMGRKEGQGWRYSGESNHRFGDLVIAHFNELAHIAEEIAPSQKKEAHLWLIRIYVGCLFRWFVALGGEGSEEQ